VRVAIGVAGSFMPRMLLRARASLTERRGLGSDFGTMPWCIDARFLEGVDMLMAVLSGILISGDSEMTLSGWSPVISFAAVRLRLLPGVFSSSYSW
jgi:hypothetical protein